MEKRCPRVPRPNLLPSMVRPTACANSPLPSASIVTLPSALADLPQAPMTKASLTAVQAISSTPLPFSSSAFSTKPGRWRAEQVGVKAPGTENSATVRPAKKSSEATCSGPFSVILTKVVLGQRSPFELVMVCHLDLLGSAARWAWRAVCQGGGMEFGEIGRGGGRESRG